VQPKDRQPSPRRPEKDRLGDIPLTQVTAEEMVTVPAVQQKFTKPTNHDGKRELGVPESWLTCVVCGCTNELDAVDALRIALHYLQATVDNIEAVEAIDRGVAATLSIPLFIVGCPCCEHDLAIPMDVALSITLAEHRASKAEARDQEILKELAARKTGDGNGNGKKSRVN
jgi:hypothetical protein